MQVPPPSLPPSKLSKQKKLPQPFQNQHKSNSKAEQHLASGAGKEKGQFSKQPHPKRSSYDIDIAELKRKLQTLSTNYNSAGSDTSKPKPAPKLSPSIQRAAQAKIQPLLPPTAKPRKPIETSGFSDDFPFYTNSGRGKVGEVGGRGLRGGGKNVGGRGGVNIGENEGRGGGKNIGGNLGGKRGKGGEEMGKGSNSMESERNRPPLRSPLPVPRGKISLSPTTSPTHPVPTPKAKLGSRERDSGPAIQHEYEELCELYPQSNTSTRPVPRARTTSKEKVEQGKPSTWGDGKKEKGLVAEERKDNVVVTPKSHVPRGRASRDSRDISPLVQTLQRFSPSPLPSHITGEVTAIRKRKKGGSIRMPFWNAPPPPLFSPPSSPTRRQPRK